MIETLPVPHIPPNRVQQLPTNPLGMRVRRSFCNSPYRHLRNVRCDCVQGVVLLMGTLPSFFLKQMAQETVKRLIGVTEIDNQVEVIYAEEYAG